MMVANQLAKAPMFKRTGRGQYLHKGGGAAKKRGRKPGRPKGSKNKARPGAEAAMPKAAS